MRPTGYQNTKLGRRFVRHPAHVTADRLKGHVQEWHDKLDGQERDDFSRVIQALEEIGAGDRVVR